MSLRDEITADLAEAFDTDLADAVSSFTGSRWEATGPYDPIEQEQAGETITYAGRGVFGSYGIQVSEALNIPRTDVKLTAVQAEVSAIPKIDDDIEHDGENYRVIHVGQDPVGATWTLQIRRV